MTPDDSNRIEKLEFILAHLQKAFDELNMVVFSQQGELDSLRRALSRLEDGYSNLVEANRAPRTLADDKPPHY